MSVQLGADPWNSQPHAVGEGEASESGADIEEMELYEELHKLGGLKKGSSFHLQGKTQEEPSCPEQFLSSSPRGSFFQKHWRHKARKSFLGTEVACDASLHQQDTAPLTGRGEGREWLPKFSPNPSHQICPKDLDHQPQLLPLFFCASFWIMDCPFQISKAIKKIICALPAPSPNPLWDQTHEKKNERRGKEDGCKHLQWLLTNACSHFTPTTAPKPKLKLKLACHSAARCVS